MKTKPIDDSEFDAFAADSEFDEFTAEAPSQMATGPATSATEAALQGFGSGASFGFLPWLQSKAEAIGSGENPFGDKAEIYRQQWESRDKKLRQEHPVASAAGSVAGSLAVPMPGLGAAKAATMGGKLVRGMGSAALQGGVTGLGEGLSKGMTPEQIAFNSLKGAGLGAGMVGGIGAGAKGIQAAGSVINPTMASGLLRTIGTNKAASRGLSESQKIELARDVASSGVLGRGGFGTNQGVGQRVGELVQSREQGLQDIFGTIDQQGRKVDPAELMAALQAEKELAVRTGKGVQPGYMRSLDDLIDNVATTAQARGESSGMGLADINQFFKRPLSAAKGKAMRSIATPEGEKAGMSKGYDVTRMFIEDQAGKLAGPETRNALMSQNRALGRSLQMEQALEELNQRATANRMFGLSEQNMTTAGAAAMGNPVGALAGAATSLGLRSLARPGFAAGFRMSDAAANMSPALGYEAALAGGRGLAPTVLMDFMTEQKKPVQASTEEEAQADLVQRMRVRGGQP